MKIIYLKKQYCNFLKIWFYEDKLTHWFYRKCTDKGDVPIYFWSHDQLLPSATFL